MRNRLLGTLCFLLAWQLIAMSGLVTNLILPSPIESFRALIANLQTLLSDSAATLWRLAVGFSIGTSLGILVGTTFGLNNRLHAFFELIIDFFRSLPVITLFPLSMILFGLGDNSKMALTAWTVFLLTVVNTIYGIKQVPRIRILAARTLGASGINLVWKVLIPSALPTIVAGLRLAVSLGLVVVLVTEMFTGTNLGLGKRIYEMGLIYEIPGMFAAIIVSGILGFALNKAIMIFERRIVHWSGQ
jgi:NitT/TauT family transport system permease protein